MGKVYLVYAETDDYYQPEDLIGICSNREDADRIASIVDRGYVEEQEFIDRQYDSVPEGERSFIVHLGERSYAVQMNKPFAEDVPKLEFKATAYSPHWIVRLYARDKDDAIAKADAHYQWWLHEGSTQT